MTRNIFTLTLLALVTAAGLFLTGCASTQPNSVTGTRPVVNDKGRVLSYTR